MTTGVLAQLNVSNGGMPKRPVASAMVRTTGVDGDSQRDLRHHGGPDRAVCIYSQELYGWLRDAYEIDLPNGAVGENFTTRGIDLQSLKPGDLLRVGECVVQITDVRIPCKNLNQWDPRLLKVINGHSGWVARVLEEAIVQPGDRIELVARQPAT